MVLWPVLLRRIRPIGIRTLSGVTSNVSSATARIVILAVSAVLAGAVQALPKQIPQDLQSAGYLLPGCRFALAAPAGALTINRSKTQLLYVSGLCYGTVTTMASVMTDIARDLVCIPQDTTIHDLVAAVVTFADKTRIDPKQPLLAAAELAFLDAWPCSPRVVPE